MFNKVYRAPSTLLRVVSPSNPKTPRAQSDAHCHFDPFGHTQGRLREKSFLDPSHSLGMTGLRPSLGVLCVFARVIFFPIPYSNIQPKISNIFG